MKHLLTSSEHPAYEKFDSQIIANHEVQVSQIFRGDFDEVVFLLRGLGPGAQCFRLNMWMRPEDYETPRNIDRIAKLIDLIVSDRLRCPKCSTPLHRFTPLSNGSALTVMALVIGRRSTTRLLFQIRSQIVAHGSSRAASTRGRPAKSCSTAMSLQLVIEHRAHGL